MTMALAYICDEEDGPAVGVVYDLPNGLQIWCGEISHAVYDQQDSEVREALGPNGGAMIVRGRRGAMPEVLGRAATVEAGIEIVAALAAAVAISDES